jgi:hypothetical protein
MRRNLVLILCWLAMFGNVSMIIPVCDIAARNRDLVPAMFELWGVAVLSFACAFILRGTIVKSIRQSRSESSTRPAQEVQAPGNPRDITDNH